MKTLFLTTALALSLMAFSHPAEAGNQSLKARDGSRIHLNCTNSGCIITRYSRSGKRGKVSRRAGGRKNFLALRSYYQRKGYR